MSHACAKKDCEGKGRWTPVLQLFAGEQHGDHPPAEAQFLQLTVCDVHRLSMVAEDLLTDASWERVCAGFVSMGKARPVRERCKLRWLPVPEVA